ncbi:type II secretion system F family protein [Fodinicola acaciae]|uniref:type II secretion system F family protein n=1 Tax=Fodinicola acaciae TaxID=2681555 RepID=UPI0013D8444B|nr:type II secretion system F family protein [Fodinicola acaciae]
MELSAAIAAAALLSAAALVMWTAPTARRAVAVARLTAVVSSGVSMPTEPPAARKRHWMVAAAVLAGVATWVLIGDWWGLPVGAVAALAIHRVSGRLEPAGARAERAAATGWLPFAADLLAAAVRVGATTESALRVVADAVGGPVGERFAAVGHALSMGAPPDEAWQSLADLPEASALIQAGVRSASSGAALADTATAVAERIRADLDATAEASARRAGVLVVLPLGLCFLPAFVLLGVMPVVGSVLAGVLR